MAEAVEKVNRTMSGPSVFMSSVLGAVITQPDGTRINVSATVETVTPAMAEAWLSGMERNRKASLVRIGSYARDMEARRWSLTSQGIAFDERGKLIDGQHRLHAVVESGMPSVFLVVRGLPGTTQNKIDTGRNRSAADQYAMWTGSDRGKDLASCARVMRLIRTGWLNANEVLTYEELAAEIERYKPELDWALATFQGRRLLASAPVIGAWAYAYGATNEVSKWAHSFREGEGLFRGDPLLALRNHVASAGPTKLPAYRRSLALRTLRALWAKLHGESLSKLYDSADGVVGFVQMRGEVLADEWREWKSRTVLTIEE